MNESTIEINVELTLKCECGNIATQNFDTTIPHDGKPIDFDINIECLKCKSNDQNQVERNNQKGTE